MLAGPRNRNGLARAQAIGSIDNNTCSWLRTAVKDGVLAFGEGYLYRLHLRDLTALAVVVDDPDKERTIQAGLDGGRRDDKGVGPIFQDQVDVDELVGKEDRIFVIKDGFEFVGARSGIDLVVGGEKVAGSQLLGVTAVVGVNGDSLVGREALIERHSALVLLVDQ